jgi:hypothetical protein
MGGVTIDRDTVNAINEAHIELHKVMTAYSHSLCRHDGSYKVLYLEYIRAMNAVTELLVTTLKGVGYEAIPNTGREYPELDSQLYVKVEGHDVSIWYSFYGVPRYWLMLQDGMGRLVVDNLPTYMNGICVSSLESVANALDDICTTIRKYKQCNSCYYCTDSHDYYCGLGAVPEPPACRHYCHR